MQQSVCSSVISKQSADDFRLHLLFTSRAVRSQPLAEGGEVVMEVQLPLGHVLFADWAFVHDEMVILRLIERVHGRC